MASERKKAAPEEIWEIIKSIGQSQDRIGQSQDRIGQAQDRLVQSQDRLATSQKETDRKQKELQEFQKETDRMLQKMAKKAEKDREEDKQFMRKFREVQEDTWHLFKETERQMKKTDSYFQSQWGKLMESLVDGDLVKHLKQRNIEVTGTRGRLKSTWNGKEYEFDNIVINGKEVVVVEVKTSLGPEEVRHFLDKLKDFKYVAHEYKDKIIYGLVAYLRVDSEADKFAEKQGLFVVRATGNSSSLLNAENFTPKHF